MEKVFAALSNPDRIGIVLWLVKNGPARQVELLRVLEAERNVPVNPGTATAVLKPLLDSGLLVRERARGPISVRDPGRTLALLRAAASIGADHAEAARAQAEEGFDALRRAVVHASSDSEASSAL